MRRFILPFLILTLLLTACGTFEVTLTNSGDLTPTPAPGSPAAGPAPLSMSSTSTEIRQLLLKSPFRWQTIFMDAQVTRTGENPRRVQIWIDQPNLSVRSLSGDINGAASTLRVADRLSLLYLDIATGDSKLAPFLDETTIVPYTPVPVNIQSGGIQSHPLSSATDPAMSNLIFPSDIAQNEGMFKPIGTEVVAYHLCLVVEWNYIQSTLPSYRAWADVSTGVFLRFQQFDKGGRSNMSSEVTVTRVDYNLPFSPELFSINMSAMPNFVSDPLEPSVVTVLPAPTSDARDPLGSVYSFVADGSYPVRVMRLVSLPASCVTGASDCPEPEVIPTPVELTSSLQPLVWSSTHNEAAWAYPVNADQRIWTLYLFDPLKKSWKELVQMDRYMDPPMWSRDGAWLAFRVQDGQGGSDVYAVRRDGSDLKKLTATDKLPAESQPYVMDAWLGESVILRSSVPGQAGTLYLLRVSDGFVKPLFDTLLTKAQFIESPDGTSLAYVDYETNSQKQLVKIITPDGKTLRDLATFASGSVLGLAWSPDGMQLAFTHRTDTTSSVYVIDSDGRNLRQVYTSTTDTQFVFSPDGKYLLVQTIDGTGEHLYSIDLTTLQAHLVQAPGIALNAAWMLPTWKK
jgi:hypothetical protein